jgi:chemotaxis protein MotB
MSDELEEAPPPPPQAEGSGAPVEEGAPTWVVTFGDMMSLLLTFFILMFSMSEVKQDRFLLAAQSLREAMGSTAEVPTDTPLGLMPDEVDPELDLSNPGLNDGATTSPVDGEGGEDVIDVFAAAYMKMIEERLQALVDSSGLSAESVEVVTEEDGVYLRIRNAALFASAQADVLPESRGLIRKLSGITAELGVPTIVSGHADSRPIQTAAFPSNWELSAARAAGVARILVMAGQAPESLEVQSFGEFRPIGDNATVDGRAQNRRVEIFFSRDYIRNIALELQEAGTALESPDEPAEPATEADAAHG